MNNNTLARAVVLRGLSAILLVLVLLSTPLAKSQDNDEDAYQRALPQFTRLLGSERSAKDFLSMLYQFSQSKHRSFSMVVKLAQRSLVAGIDGKFSLQAIYRCGDIAEALDASDYEYSMILVTIFDMRLRNVSTYNGLESLTVYSVPAYDLLGLAIGKSAEATKRLALQDKLRVNIAAEALLAMFEVKYGKTAP